MQSSNINLEKLIVKRNINVEKNCKKLQDHFIHFTDVAIHPNYQGQKLGTKLMQYAVYSFPSGTRLALEVNCNNISACKCYTKCGFQVQRMVLNYYGDGQNCYKLTLIR